MVGLACSGSGEGRSTAALTLGGGEDTTQGVGTGSTGESDGTGDAGLGTAGDVSETLGDETGEQPDAPWTRHTFDVQTQTWTSIGLDQLWIEPNAPPPYGIVATTSLTHFDRLFVITDDGTFYERRDGTWQTPVALEERFPMLDGISVAAMTHVPGQSDDTVEDLYFIDNPLAVIYLVHEDGTVEYGTTATSQDEPGGAPQGTGRARWAFAVTDPSLIGLDPEWMQWFLAYDDGNLYRFDAGLEWMSWPLADNPFFGVSNGQPHPPLIEAAYHDDAVGRVHFIAP